MTDNELVMGDIEAAAESICRDWLYRRHGNDFYSEDSKRIRQELKNRLVVSITDAICACDCDLAVYILRRVSHE